MQEKQEYMNQSNRQKGVAKTANKLRPWLKCLLSSDEDLKNGGFSWSSLPCASLFKKECPQTNIQPFTTAEPGFQSNTKELLSCEERPYTWSEQADHTKAENRPLTINEEASVEYVS